MSTFCLSTDDSRLFLVFVLKTLNSSCVKMYTRLYISLNPSAGKKYGKYIKVKNTYI